MIQIIIMGIAVVGTFTYAMTTAAAKADGYRKEKK